MADLPSSQTGSHPSVPSWADEETIEGEGGERTGEPRERFDLLATRVGQTRLGHHVLLHKLGQGGMGIVYAAYDEKLARKVAIKLLRSHGDEHARGRLVREARALAQLSHPNVVQIYEIGEFEQFVFLVMELVEGITLQKWRSEQPRSVAEVLEVFTAAGRGLLAAHEKGLVHRDFKPDNVMIRRDGQVLVMDFGLARTSDTAQSGIFATEPTQLDGGLTLAGAIVGTPGYMAPEQFLQGETDARTDQFSFCIALWEAVYDQRPFRGSTLTALSAAVLEGRIAKPIGDNVPKWLHEVLSRGLAVDPDQRWPSLSELLDALTLHSQAKPLWPSWSTWVGSGAVVAVVLGLGLVVSRGEPEPPTCPDSHTRVATIWNEASVDELAHHWTHAGPGGASTRAWLQVHARIDAWVGVWEAAHTEVCQAHLIRHESSDALHDRQMACLDRQLGSLADLLGLLAGLTSEEQLVGVDATLALPQIEDCLDRERLLDPPEYADPLRREEFERELARIELLGALGRWKQVGEQAAELAEASASEPESADLLVLAKLQVAVALDELGEAEAAQQIAMEAARVAVTVTQPEIRGYAFLVLANVLMTRNSPAEAERWLSLALAIAQSSDVAKLTREAAIIESRLAGILGEHDRALQANQRALDHTDPEAAPLEHAGLIRQFALLHLQTGDIEAALREYANASAVFERETAGTHPALPVMLYDQAVAYEDLGRLSEAETMFERSATRSAELAGDRAPYTILARGRQAKVHGMLGECERAQRELDELIPAARELLREPLPRLLHFLGWRVEVCGYSTPEALPLSEEILARLLEAVGPEHPATLNAHMVIGVALVRRGELVRARAELEQGLAGMPDPRVEVDVAPRARWLWALGSTALGIVELREGQVEAGRTRIAHAGPDLRDTELRELAEREMSSPD